MSHSELVPKYFDISSKPEHIYHFVQQRHPSRIEKAENEASTTLTAPCQSEPMIYAAKLAMSRYKFSLGYRILDENHTPSETQGLQAHATQTRRHVTIVSLCNTIKKIIFFQIDLFGPHE